MGRSQRIGTFFRGLMMLITSIALCLYPDEAYPVVASLLGLSFLIAGIRRFIYYMTMARHMVGGRMVLYLSLLLIDLGIFTLSIVDVPLIYVMVYLFCIHGLTGVTEVLRAMEVKRMEGPWKRKMIHAVISIAFTVACLTSIRNSNLVVFIYSAGLFYSALTLIVTAFRNTGIVNVIEY